MPNRDVWRREWRAGSYLRRDRSIGAAVRIVPDLEHMVVALDQARQHRCRSEVDFIHTGGNLDTPLGAHVGDAFALDHDHLLAR